MPYFDYHTAAMRYAANGCAEAAAAAFSQVSACPRGACPSAAELEQVLRAAVQTDSSSGAPGEDTARRLVGFAYALAATLPGEASLVFPSAPGPLLARLYQNRDTLQTLREILSQLEALRAACDAFPAGTFHLVKAREGILHFRRIGEREAADAIFNRTNRILVEPVGEKSTEVNPFGFTITVQDIGHSPDHSYYDIV